MDKINLKEVQINLPKDTISQLNEMSHLFNVKSHNMLVIKSVTINLFILRLIIKDEKKIIIVYDHGEEGELAPDIKPTNLKLSQQTIKEIKEIQYLNDMDMATHTIVNAVALTKRLVTDIKHHGAKIYSEDKSGKRTAIYIKIDK